MCQLTAIIPQRDLTEEEKKLQVFIMSELLMTNSKSGNRDGVGIASVNTSYTWEDSAQEIVPGDNFTHCLQEIAGGPLIGHVRATSTGAKAKKGAHPFVEGSLILAHNGTFREYQKLDAYKTFEEDDDPVDSHVVCRELYHRMKMGGEGFTADLIKEVVDDAGGSYAMLIFDATAEDLWVVRGSCSLNQATIGPLTVVNTTAKNLDGVLKTARMVARTVLGMDVELEESTNVTLRTINKVEGGKLQKVADIPYKTSKNFQNHHNSNYYSRGYSSNHWEQEYDTEQARELADRLVNATKITGLCFHTIEYASKYVFDKEWYELKNKEVEALVESLEELFLEHYTSEKGKLWTEIWAQVAPKYPHEVLDDLGVDNEFPFVLQDTETLHAMFKLTQREVA